MTFLPSNQFSIMNEFPPVPMEKSSKAVSEIVHDSWFVFVNDL
jgi:hypothetical protein